MNTQSYQEIPLSHILPSTMNPRKNFDGKKFDELVESIRMQGVLEPILVRPAELPISKAATAYEIVAGERRYRALCKVAADDCDETRLMPSIIRDLSNDEAFDVMTIENLHRSDLTPYEEAEGFKFYLDKRGPDHLTDLAERTGISAGYIRRHVAVFELDTDILESWRSGYLKFGHLEQLLRLKGDKKQLQEMQKEVKAQLNRTDDDGFTVRDLKEMIDDVSIGLSKALFDLQAEGCTACGKNTDVQKSLFDLDADTRCNDPECFRAKLTAWLKEHWHETEMHKKFKTVRGVIQADLPDKDRYNYSYFSSSIKPGAQCKQCDDFVTLLAPDGSPYTESSHKICIGDKKCYEAIAYPERTAKGNSANNKKEPGEKDSEAPRIAWHGEFFREEFYKEELPKRLQALTDITKRAFLLMVALVKSNNGIADVFCDGFNLKVAPHWLENEQIFSVIKGKKNKPLNVSDIDAILNQAMVAIVMQPNTFNADARRMVADYIGIDLQTEWRLTEAYLQKKTTAEILALGEKLDIFSDKKAGDFLYEVLGGKRGKFDKCKKGELIRIILESGVDLAGKVPDEILK